MHIGSHHALIRQAARKKCQSRDSAASTADFSDTTGSEESQDEFTCSDFSSESDSVLRSPGPSSVQRRVCI